MHDNFENLQKRCKQYKLKKRVKYLVPIVSIILLFWIYLSLSEDSSSVKSKLDTTVAVTKTKEIKKVKITTKPKIEKQIIEDIPYALQIDKKYRLKQQTYYIAKPTFKEEIVPKNLQEVISNKPQRVYIKRDEPKALAITVKKLGSVEDMIAYYNKEKKYSLALKIAQTYYDANNYSKSLLWSKKANLLNRNADGAWILYAKSEYAVGNHEKAIKILNLYLTNTDSNEAKSLLLTWTQGN